MPNLLYYGGVLALRLGLVAAGVLLPLAALRLPVSRIQRYGVLLLALVAVANGLWLSLYAFGEDDYTNDGQSRWQTHNSRGSHLYYVIALAFELLLVATAVSVRRRPQLLRLVAAFAALTSPFLWGGSAFAFDNN
jgi:hypothetical protein